MAESKKITIGAFIVAKNEERDLPSALKSLLWCDQIVVVDMASKDNTKEIAKSYGAEVFSFRDVGYVEPALQFAAEKLNTTYILRLDADEIINLELKEFIVSQAEEEKYEAFFLRRKNYIFGEYSKNNRYFRDLQLRFWRRGSVVHTDQIHTHPIICTKKIYKAKKNDLACIVHFNQRSIYEYIEKMNRYTEKEPLSKLKFKNIYYEFFINYILKMIILIIKQKSFMNKNNLIIEYLTSTYHFVKYIKSQEKSKKYSAIEEYQKIANIELDRLKN